MQSKPNKYSRGKIYKVVSDKTDKIYIGSTISTLGARMSQHKSKYKRQLNGQAKKNTCHLLLSKDPNCRIVLLEAYPCKSKQQLLARERQYVEANKSKCVNYEDPSHTDKKMDSCGCGHTCASCRKKK